VPGKVIRKYNKVAIQYSRPGRGSVPALSSCRMWTDFMINCLKVPKLENFELAFFTLNNPIWVVGLGTEAKNDFFLILVLISMDFGFLPHTECSVNNFFNAAPKIKSCWRLLLAHMYSMLKMSFFLI
jgi:hypothetical protein